MKRKYPLMILLAVTILIGSCTQATLPEIAVGEVVFEFQGDLDGEPILLEAGKQSVFQTISVEQYESGLYEFIGNLGPEDCPDCPDQLELRFRDHTLSEIGQLLSGERAPREGIYPFFLKGKTESSVEVSFDPDTGSSTARVSWDFGDGVTSMDMSPTHTYRDTIGDVVTVCLQVDAGNGCISSICNVIHLTDTSCQAAFQYEVDPSSQFVTFMDQSRGTLPIRYRWSFGDGYSATLGNPGYYFGQNGKYEVCLEIEDAAGCIRELCKEISPDLTTCTAGFTYQVTNVESGEALQENSVSLMRKNSEGVSFFTELASQDSTTYFEVIESERYPEDQSGLAAWKLRFRVRAMMADLQGQTKFLTGTGTMAIGFPLSQ